MRTLEIRMRAKLKRDRVYDSKKQMQYDMKYILKRVTTGDIDEDDLSQRIKLNIAINKGLIRREPDGTYVKEE